MDFESPPMLPPAAGIDHWLARLGGYLREQTGRSADEVLSGFLGIAAPASAFHVGGIDHVAVYLGDYRREEEVEGWLAALAARPEIAALAAGPSSIAPRFHGTPGYWIQCRLNGMPVELFTCRHWGRWRAQPPERRRALMSHFALAVDGAEHVEPVLRYLAHYPRIELLCFQAEDEVGHTYGHLLHRELGRVLEIVHDPARRAGTKEASAAPEARQRVPGSAPGPYFVDPGCVDCDTCRAIAPEHFQRHEEGGYSYLRRQPEGEDEVSRVEEALECCPAGAIGREPV